MAKSEEWEVATSRFWKCPFANTFPRVPVHQFCQQVSEPSHVSQAAWVQDRADRPSRKVWQAWQSSQALINRHGWFHIASISPAIYLQDKLHKPPLITFSNPRNSLHGPCRQLQRRWIMWILGFSDLKTDPMKVSRSLATIFVVIPTLSYTSYYPIRMDFIGSIERWKWVAPGCLRCLGLLTGSQHLSWSRLGWTGDLAEFPDFCCWLSSVMALYFCLNEWPIVWSWIILGFEMIIETYFATFYLIYLTLVTIVPVSMLFITTRNLKLLKKMSFCKARRPEVAEGATLCQATTAARRLEKSTQIFKLATNMRSLIYCMSSNGTYILFKTTICYGELGVKQKVWD